MIEYQNIFESDYDILTKIMAEAFDNDVSKNTSFLKDELLGYCDGTLIRQFNENVKYISKKIIYLHKIIGAYTIFPKGNVYYLKMIFIDPHYSSMGVGTRIWKDIESTYPEAKMWYVETSINSNRNNHFYTSKCGFRFIGKKRNSNGIIKVYKKESYFAKCS